MPHALIYKPAKTATQSGRRQTHHWLLRYNAELPSPREPLMGWSGCNDTQTQIILKFARQEDAIAYAERNHIGYTLAQSPRQQKHPKAYADNFLADRVEGNWTH